MKPCPCGTGKTYQECCARFLTGNKLPATPEQLMRSRYTAYSRANIDYIIATMKSPAADNFDKQNARLWAKQVTWVGLEVTHSQVDDDAGFVEFIASYRDGDGLQRLHELSRFRLIEGRWYYIDGELY